MELFDKEEASSQAYNNVRNAEVGMMVIAKSRCLDMWAVFEPYADSHFTKEIKRDFDGRFWEMDLTCTLLELGYNVSCPKPGPDMKIEGNIWIEAICPTGGHKNSPDKVPEIVTGLAQSVKYEPIALRFTSAIIEKYQKYIGYINGGVIREFEPYVIAINGNQIPNARLDFPMPRIARAVLSIGSEYITCSRESGEAISSGYNYQESISKSNGAEISIGIFLDKKYEGISAILYSCVDVCNRSERLGQDFILIHNPLAKNPISEGYFRLGREAIVSIDNEEDYSIRWLDYEVA